MNRPAHCRCYVESCCSSSISAAFCRHRELIFPVSNRALAGVERSRKLLDRQRLASAAVVSCRPKNELPQPCSDRIDPLFGHFLAAGGSSKNDAKLFAPFAAPPSNRLLDAIFHTSTGWNEEYV